MRSRITRPLSSKRLLFLSIGLAGAMPLAASAQTVTAADGSFTFTGLAAGTYVVSEVIPAGFVQTLPGGNGNVTVTVAAPSLEPRGWGASCKCSRFPHRSCSIPMI